MCIFDDQGLFIEDINSLIVVIKIRVIESYRHINKQTVSGVYQFAIHNSTISNSTYL